MKFLYVSLLIMASLLTGGCAVGPRFKTPAMDTPPGFLGQGVVSQQSRLPEVGMADLPWWDVFADDTLHELVRTALTNNYERRIVIKENQINLLLGRNPGTVPRNTTLLRQDTPPEVPAGLPSDLLRRRPDIRAAEQTLRAANAQIGVAIAQCFPKIGLTTLFGRVSPDLNSFNNDAMAWSIGGNLAGPIFQGGALMAQIHQARAQSEEAAITYEQAVRTSFQDVANALITRVKLEVVFTQQVRCVRCYADAVAVSRDRYIAGKASYYEVLEAQQQLFPAENNLAQTQLNRLTAVIQLYKTLGGGWNLPDGKWGAVP